MLWRRAFLSGESHGQRSLAGYSPKGRKGSDMADQLGTSTTISHVPKGVSAQELPSIQLTYWVILHQPGFLPTILKVIKANVVYRNSKVLYPLTFEWLICISLTYFAFSFNSLLGECLQDEGRERVSITYSLVIYGLKTKSGTKAYF